MLCTFYPNSKRIKVLRNKKLTSWYATCPNLARESACHPGAEGLSPTSCNVFVLVWQKEGLNVGLDGNVCHCIRLDTKPPLVLRKHKHANDPLGILIQQVNVPYIFIGCHCWTLGLM